MLIEILIIAALVILDRVIKIWLTGLLASGPIVLIPGVIGLNYCENTGAAFSILSSHTWLLSVFTAVAVCFLFYLLYRYRGKGWMINTSLVMVIAGGLGNLYDRIFVHYVVDYIEVLLFRYAIFNFADCLITVGAFLLIIYMAFFDGKSSEKKADAVKAEEVPPESGEETRDE